MSDMLLIVPSDWVEVDMDLFSTTGLDPFSLQQSINAGTFYDFTNILEQLGTLPINMQVIDAKIFDDGTGVRIWVKFGPDA